MRPLVATVLVLLASCKENRAELDRAEREDRPRGLEVRPDVDPGAGGYNPLLGVGPPPADPWANRARPVATPRGLAPGARMFAEMFAQVIPGQFCAESMYFRQCFAIDEAECLRRVAAALEVCIREHADAIPEAPGPDSGRRAGEVLGACAGSRYEIALAAEGRRSARAECDDIDRWR